MATMMSFVSKHGFRGRWQKLQGNDQEPGPVLSEPARAFIADITMDIAGVLQTPAAPKRRTKQLPPDFTLRRSARLKNKHEKTSSVEVQTQTDLTQQLELVEANATICDQDLQRYCSLFDTPLSQSHVAALAALFGWMPPLPGDTSWKDVTLPSPVTEEQ